MFPGLGCTFKILLKNQANIITPSPAPNALAGIQLRIDSFKIDMKIIYDIQIQYFVMYKTRQSLLFCSLRGELAGYEFL